MVDKEAKEVIEEIPTTKDKEAKSEWFVTLRRGEHGLWNPIGIRVYKGEVLEEFEIYTDDTRFHAENRAMSWLMKEQGLL